MVANGAIHEGVICKEMLIIEIRHREETVGLVPAGVRHLAEYLDHYFRVRTTHLK